MTGAPDLRDELFRSTVCRMMESHGARLLGHALVLASGLRHAPSAQWLRFTGGHVRELTARFAELSELYRPLAGVDLDPATLIRDDARTPPAPDSAGALVAAQLVVGRQCRWQLREHDPCAYTPYRAFVVPAVAELDARLGLVEQAAEDMARDEAAAPALRDALERWMDWAAGSFGRPNTPGMAYAIRTGLRRRDASATLKDFLDDMRAVARARKLPLSERWLPAPERPSLVAMLQSIAESSRDETTQPLPPAGEDR